eukprot:6131491-Pleurochrysis_carterae.AAC.1
MVPLSSAGAPGVVRLAAAASRRRKRPSSTSFLPMSRGRSPSTAHAQVRRGAVRAAPRHHVEHPPQVRQVPQRLADVRGRCQRLRAPPAPAPLYRAQKGAGARFRGVRALTP